MTRQPQPRTLQHRMLILLRLSSVAIIALLAIGAGGYYLLSRFEENAWQGRQAEAADNAAKTVANFIHRVQANLRLIGLLDPTYLEQHPGHLTQFLQQDATLLEIIRLDKAGQVVATAHAKDEVAVLDNVFTMAQSSWFLEAQAGQPYLGDMHLSAGSEPHLVIAMPTPDGGVVAARLYINVLWQVVSQIHFGQTGGIYIINQSGDIVAHPNQDLVLATKDISAQPEFVQIAQSPHFEWQGNFVNLDNHAVVGLTRAIPNTTWIVVTEISQSEARTVSQTSLYFGLGILFFVVLGLLFTANYLNRLIFKPMEQLRQGVDKIGRGDWQTQVAVDSEDEIGQVAIAFNQMISQLQDREERLIQARDEAIRLYAEQKEMDKELLRLTAVEQELSLAHTIQQNLLPSPQPSWLGLDVLCYTESAREVGGDLYAYHAFDLSQDEQPTLRYALTIGDVSGKGMPAALLMAVTLASFRTIVGHGLAPKELLARMNKVVREYTQTTHQNCALVYLEISHIFPAIVTDTWESDSTYTLNVANAGCVMPIIKRVGGQVEWLEVGGLPLGSGLGAELSYAELTLELFSGDMVILTSDGVIEAHNATKEMFGFDRFEAAVKHGPQDNAANMMAHLQYQLVEFVGEAELHDDLTIIVVKI